MDIYDAKKKITFGSLDSFKDIIRRNHNLANGNYSGIIEVETLLHILGQVQNDVSLFYEEQSTFAHSSVLEVLVFSKNEFGDNMRFLGLGEFRPGLLNKYLQECELNQEDIGLIHGKIESRFSFSMFHDNNLSKERVEKTKKAATVEELERIVKERRTKLGL